MEGPTINIITRASRINFFKLNYESIHNQTYTNVNHIVTYETPEMYDKLKHYKDITLVKVPHKSKIKGLVVSWNHNVKTDNYLNPDHEFLDYQVLDHGKDHSNNRFINEHKDVEPDGSDPDTTFEYLTLSYEIPAFVQGLYKTAKTKKITLTQAIDEFLEEREAELTDKESAKVKQIWTNWAKENLPAAQLDEKLTIGDKIVKTIHKNNSDNPEDHEIEYEDGTREPYLKHIIKEAAKKKSKKNNKKLNKPMRDSSGGKAYKVYVKDPKTKKIKTIRFGSGGLRAKINDKKARNAFAKRHNCSAKKDKTKAGYWSCRLPRYAKLLGLKSNFGGFW